MIEPSIAGLKPKKWLEALVQARERMASTPEFVVEGTLNRMVGMTLRLSVPSTTNSGVLAMRSRA